MPFRFSLTNCANQKRPDFLLEMDDYEGFWYYFKTRVRFNSGLDLAVVFKCRVTCSLRKLQLI